MAEVSRLQVLRDRGLYGSNAQKFLGLIEIGLV